MSKNQRYFLGTLTVRIGEYENDTRYLLVANTNDRALLVLDQAAANFYGDGNQPREDGGYYANHGEVHVSPKHMREIGLAEFETLKAFFHVRYDENVKEQGAPEEGTSEAFKAFAKSASNLLEQRGTQVSHSVMLDVLAGAVGEKNWQVFHAKLARKEDAQKQPAQPAAASEPKGLKGILKLQQDLLEEIGFSFSPDVDQPGLWVWTAVTEGCDSSFDSLAAAVGDAWASAAEQAKAVHQMSEAQWNGIGFLRQQELLRQLGGQDGSGEATYEVDVCRVAYGHKTLRVRANSEQAARELAVEEAANLEYSESNADYEVTSIAKL